MHKIGGTAMYKQLGIIALGLGIALAACEKGPAEKAGERIDKAVDALSGKGPVEKAGKRVDRMLVGVLPTWPHSRSWGYGPSGTVGTILVVLLILVLLGRI